MRELTVWVLVLATVAAACTRSSPRPSRMPQQVPAPLARAAPSSVLTLVPLTIKFRGFPIARLLADGRTESVGSNTPGEDAKLEPGPTLRADGTILLTKGGFTARVERSGDIYVVPPPGSSQREELFGRISGDQLTFADSTSPWHVRVEGATLVYNSSGVPTNEIEGAVDAGSRRLALVMTAAFFLEMAITSE